MYKNIMVAIDDSETSRCALVEAAHIARCSNAKLYVTHVADETLMGMHGRTFSTTMNLDHALAAIAEAGRKLKQCTDALEEAEMDWLEVSAELEAVETAYQGAAT